MAHPAAAQTGADPIIAQGNGLVIKRSQLEEIIGAIKRASLINHEAITPEKLKAIENQTLKRMIQVRILLSMATDADKANGQTNARQQLAALLARAGSQEEFDNKLKSVGMTPEGLQTKILQEATATATLTRKLGVTISEAEARQYYDHHPESFTANGGPPVEFKSAETKIKEFLIRQKTEEQSAGYLEKLYRAANVQILDPAVR